MKEVSMTQSDFRYAIDIYKNTAYITPINDLSHYHPLVKDSDFFGNKIDCEEFIEKNKITEIIGEFIYTKNEK